AVYLPYKLSFFDGGILIAEKLFLDGEYPSPVTLSEKAGYKFLGWQKDGGGVFDFSTGVSEDLKLYSAYKLLPPEFSISSLEFTYDGKERELAFSSISHPLLNNGELSYLWYLGGECISSSSSVKIRDVSDSGKYICKLKFTHNGNESETLTEELSVTVRKAEILIPEIPVKEYTGNRLYPEITSCAYYEVSCEGAEDAGTYPVLVKLRDGENYKFAGRNENELSIDFKIIPAKNAWTVPLSVQNAYFGCPLNYRALAKFGEVRYTFSTAPGGVYEEKIPKDVGTYFIRAEVLSGANYEAIVSEPLSFSILADVIVGISVKDSPKKLEYCAFERFDATGATLLVSYSSGKAVEISGEAIAVKHPRAEYFLFGDTYVTLSYGGREITLGIKTKKAEYDTSGILFPDKSVVYDGKAHAPEYRGTVPVGRDGIALECFVEALKTDVGVYEIKLIFESKSANYNSPNPIFSRLEITPRKVDVIWDVCEFVYDGGAHTPRAYFINENGAKVFVNVLGAATFAGEYSAFCEFDNGNYTLNNSSCDFKILKADYDLSGAFWSKSEFTYDGEEKTVSLSGLPSGVSVIGYTDNKATRAGTYLAKATLSYDTVNYNQPKVAPFPFTIRRAEYSLAGFSFSSEEAVYDGEVHYPILIGDMPSGVDGSKLSYSFDRGARRVSDGRVKVTVSFSSDSENYNVPQSMEAYVTIIPKGIVVAWDSSDFIFSGEIQAPRATAEESLIYVVGGQASAGIHTVTAFSQNSDYYVINSKCEYEIKRAENQFTEKLTALDVYEGEIPLVFAKSLSGDVSYRFFSDEALSLEIEAPTAPGIYYAVAESFGSENYTAIRSEAKKFSVIELVPVAIYPEIIISSPSAFSTLGTSEVKVTLEYNSGKRELVSFENIEIEYQNGESLW
ncbi:MAG: InlB B-repeat-containing protein, partial [Clostridia bacterium]|nr:InlB B-repeat-containing protein [Clostridia bacterium]